MKIDTSINTIGALKAAGYQPKSLKEELRSNFISKLKSGESTFDGIKGYHETVIPDIQRAILSRHNILLLGLRGQAKTRIARQLVGLLDAFIPVIAGSEINDDPLRPLSVFARDQIEKYGDETEIKWVTREERFVEKLATPDVSIADLIGDIDPIKAATLKLPYSDERVMHFGLVPRAHRSIFVLNELPDLQARIQVSLFNILQEGDLQIRGFKLRLPLDIQFVFTANPEDYTNRGSIITPLKDRIESQILTHYPLSLSISKEITAQEVSLTSAQREAIQVPDLIANIIERVAFVARNHEMIDQKSGVSARLSITTFEHLVSAAERRMYLSGMEQTRVRVADLWSIVPGITGKVELVYEGEEEGPEQVALTLISEAIKEEFLEHFQDPDKSESIAKDPYKQIKNWFRSGKQVELFNDEQESDFVAKLKSVDGLYEFLGDQKIAKEDLDLFAEFVLHALVEFDVITKELINDRLEFKDILANMFDDMTD